MADAGMQVSTEPITIRGNLLPAPQIQFGSGPIVRLTVASLLRMRSHNSIVRCVHGSNVECK